MEIHYINSHSFINDCVQMKILDRFEPEMFPTGSCFEHLFTDGSEFWGGVNGNSIKMLPRWRHG